MQNSQRTEAHARSAGVTPGKIDAYWRAANYLSVGQIYLYDNPLLTRPWQSGNEDVGIMRSKELGAPSKRAKDYFDALRKFDLQDISDTKLQELVTESGLNYEAFSDLFSVPPK